MNIHLDPTALAIFRLETNTRKSKSLQFPPHKPFLFPFFPSLVPSSASFGALTQDRTNSPARVTLKVLPAAALPPSLCSFPRCSDAGNTAPPDTAAPAGHGQLYEADRQALWSQIRGKRGGRNCFRDKVMFMPAVNCTAG